MLKSEILGVIERTELGFLYFYCSVCYSVMEWYFMQKNSRARIWAVSRKTAPLKLKCNRCMYGYLYDDRERKLFPEEIPNDNLPI